MKASLKNTARKFLNTGILIILEHVFTHPLVLGGICVNKLSKSNFKGSDMAGYLSAKPHVL